MDKRLKVYNKQGEEVREINLKSQENYDKLNFSLLKQAILMYEANQRQGTASTKTRSEKRGGGRKPWRQKGTGRARAGSIRSPLWRNGGVTFGPKPKNYSYKIPKKMRRKALRESIRAKVRDNEVLILDEIEIDKPKTKEISNILKNLDLTGGTKVLLMVREINNNLLLSSRNIENLELTRVKNLNAYKVLKFKNLLVTSDALEEVPFISEKLE